MRITTRRTEESFDIKKNLCSGCGTDDVSATFEINKKFFHNFNCFMVFAQKQKVIEFISCLKSLLKERSELK